jgi:hypothetical protein
MAIQSSASDSASDNYGLDHEYDVDNNSDDHESADVHSSPRIERPHLVWTQEQSVRGWTQAQLSMNSFSAQGCDGSPLVARGGLSTNNSVQYRYECAFASRLGCQWQMRVTIRFDQATAADRFLHRNPQSPATVSSFDRTVYDRQSLVHGKKDERQVLHVNHMCDIHVSGSHCNHKGYQASGPHCLWVSHCAKLPYDLHLFKFQIENWLVANEINTTKTQIINGETVNTCQRSVMAKRCKRHCETFLRSKDDDKDVIAGYDGKMLGLCERFGLRETSVRLGPELFNSNTTYIIPGWNAHALNEHAAQGLCVLITSFNLALNFARATAWFKGRVTLAIDHTFKVRLRDVNAMSDTGNAYSV